MRSGNQCEVRKVVFGRDFICGPVAEASRTAILEQVGDFKVARGWCNSKENERRALILVLRTLKFGWYFLVQRSKKEYMKSTLKTLLTTSLTAALLLALSTGIMAQEQTSPDLSDFKITIKNTPDGIEMSSSEGSGWLDLSFTLANYQPQSIDEYGMTKLNEVCPIKDSNLADYLFTITKKNDGISLVGIEGTAWKDLSFTLPQYGVRTINQYGMTK